MPNVIKGCVDRSPDANSRNLSLKCPVIATINFPLNPKPLTEGRLAPAQEAVQGAANCEGQVGPLDLPDLWGEAAGHDRGWIGQKAHAVRTGHSAASKVIDKLAGYYSSHAKLLCILYPVFE